jgi:hypothetical protein
MVRHVPIHAFKPNPKAPTTSERIHRRRYLSIDDAKSVVFDYVERFLNPLIRSAVQCLNSTVCANGVEPG